MTEEARTAVICMYTCFNRFAHALDVPITR